MSESEAMIGYGATFAVHDGGSPGELVIVAEVTGITPPAAKVDSVDVTHMASEDATREAKPGLTDPGEMALDLNFIPGNSADVLIRAWRASNRTRACKITFPNDVTLSFSGFVSSYAPSVPNEDKMTASLTVKLSGTTVLGDGLGDEFSLDFSDPLNSQYLALI